MPRPKRPQVDPAAADAPLRPSIGFLSGGGEMGARMRALDWTRTPLGEPSSWPQSLKTVVRVMLDSRYAMWMLWGPEMTFFCNDAYLPTVGIKREWVLGARADRVWEEIWPDIGPRIARVLEHGASTWDEGLLLFLERSGFSEETYHTFSYSPVYDDASRIAGMLCVVTEVTERVIGERRLRVLRDLATAVTGVASVQGACENLMTVLGADTLDVPFAALYVLETGTGAAWLASSRGAIPEALRPRRLSADAREPWPFAGVLQEGTPQVVALDERAGRIPAPLWPDQRVTQAVVLPVRAQAQAQPTAVLIVGVSPRRPLGESYHGFLDLVAGQFATAIAGAQAYEAERRRAEALAELDRAKTTFFSNVSHEFRTPLTLMLGPLVDAAAHAQTPPSVREQLDLAHRNALRLLKLVNTLLDFSRIEAGRMQAVYEPTDLGSLTTDLASAFRSAIERANLRFEVDCAALQEPVYVDRGMWEKIVLNLLSNAFKFTLAGRIRIGLRREGDDALLEVSDTGVGIPATEMPRLFERFHRIEGTPGRSLEGSGIGLALVHELVRLHGGRIEVASVHGAGTTFGVRLPLGSAHLASEQVRTPRPLASAPSGADAYVQEALRWIPGEDTGAATRLPESAGATTADQRFASTFGARILLADDNADLRRYIRDLLGATYTVESVADGVEALAAALREPPDLVLTDVMMPKLDGFGLLQALRAREALRRIPIVMLSARAGEEARLEGLGAGADDYLVKPFSGRELLARIGALLERTRMRRESEASFRAFVEATADIVYRMSPDWSELRYLKGQDLVPDTLDPSAGWLERYIPAEERERVRAAIGAAVASRSMFQLEHRILRVDGSIGWVASRAAALLDGHGEISEWLGTATDITARRAAERRQSFLLELADRLRAEPGAALRTASDMMGRHFDVARAGIAEVDDSLTFATQRYEYAVGGLEPALGAHRLDDFGPQLVAALLANEPVMVSDIEQHPLTQQHAAAYRAAGTRSLLAVPLRRGTQLRGVVHLSHSQPRDWTEDELILLRDVADRAWAVLEQTRVQRALQEADRRKDQFLAMLAHELRNPLAPIRNGSELLARLLDEDPRARVPLQILQRQTRHLTRLVDDLLDISRIAQDRIVLQQETLSSQDLIGQAVETVRPLVSEKGQQLLVGPLDAAPHVRGDRARLVQCLANVLHNAVKYTDPGGRIDLITTASAESVRIEVSDNGCGIPTELLPHVFDLFVQSDRTLDRSQGGLGIGLSVVKRLVEMHGGRVSAASAGTGTGAHFTIELPRCAPPAGAVQPDEGPASVPRLRILVVDDNADAADALGLLLEREGHEVCTVYGSADALRRAREWQPEVVLLDIGLPQLDGYEVARRLRRDPALRQPRLIAITGYGQVDDRDRAHAAGFDEHLVKPVDLRALTTALAAATAARP